MYYLVRGRAVFRTLLSILRDLNFSLENYIPVYLEEDNKQLSPLKNRYVHCVHRRVSHDNQKSILVLFCFCSLETRDVSRTLPGNCKVTWLFILPHQVTLIQFFVPLPHTAYSWDVYFYLLGHLCVFYLFNTIGMYIVYIKKLNALVYVNAFILSFLPLCSLLVYHGNMQIFILGEWGHEQITSIASNKLSNSPW